MLRGRFGHASKRPYIQGRKFIPRLEIWSDVSFLVDTGADRTTLLPADGSRMGLNFDTVISSPIQSVGIGGTSRSYTEESTVLFNEPGIALCVYDLALELVWPDDHLMDIPSLLRREILNRWRMDYSPTTDELTLQVITADHSDSVVRLITARRFLHAKAWQSILKQAGLP